MKMTVQSIGGTIEMRDFGQVSLIFNPSVRVAHSYVIGESVTFGIDVPSLDFIEFEETDRKSVYVTLASMETMKARCKAMADEEEDEKWEKRNEYLAAT